MTALNPVYTVGFQIAEMLRSHQAMSPKLARERAIELLELVEIPDPQRRIDAYPHELSGGQRQRAMIAQALACDPAVLVADEPTTALDVTVQAEILKLIRDLRDRIDASILLITHDMGVVADLADRVVVMQRGKIVEAGEAVQVFNAPRDAYTRELLRAVPHLGALVSNDFEADHEPVPADAETPATGARSSTSATSPSSTPSGAGRPRSVPSTGCRSPRHGRGRRARRRVRQSARPRSAGPSSGSCRSSRAPHRCSARTWSASPRTTSARSVAT